MPPDRLPCDDDEFDLATAIEVLEHVPDPEQTVSEMARVARRHLLVSVPREPLWRALNMARGAYLRDLGNTPGHVNHFTKRGFACAAGAARRDRGDLLAVSVDDDPGPRRLTMSDARDGRAPARRPRSGRAGIGHGATQAYASGARILSIGIASTGLFTFAYLATASHVLDQQAYGRVSLCWAVMFVILSVIYRPVEQLLSRTIADRRARGLHDHALRVPALIQSGFAILFLAAALALRPQIEQNLFDGSSSLYWILVVGVLAYAASYFARGWLAGHQRFALYGGLVFLESTSRFLFALAVAVGIGTGQSAVALGMAVAPFVSLSVIPFAFGRFRDRGPAGMPAPDAAREGPAHAAIEEASEDLTMKYGAGFAVAVVGIMLAEQTLMNASVLIVNGHSGRALAGFVFNVMLIVRAPLQLFQAIQTSILPHLAGLEARTAPRTSTRRSA